ncbi:MAG: hypothetical protein JXM70_25890 [Pirellulales bacterium]|nr:hypothetical protein [Pirellulales bacterium]
MKTESGLYYGTLQGEVGELLSQHFQQMPTFVSAMVLSIDSTRNPSDILAILEWHKIESRLEAEALLLTPEKLYRAARVGVFTGFDEVWLLERDWPKQGVPLSSRLGEGFERSQERLPTFEACIKETRCILALADGCDLAYATLDGAVAAFLEGLANTTAREE